MQQELYQGAIPDPRSEDERAQDYQSEEVAAAAPVTWREKPRTEWRKFPVRDQDGSSTCVAQTGAKMLGIENTREEPNNQFMVFSARDIYERRQNKPGAGMWGTDALSILCKFGATLEERLPSQKMSEDQIEAAFSRTQEDLEIASKYRGGGYVHLPIDIDAIADIVVNKGKPVMIFTYAEWPEWTDVPEIKNKYLSIDNAPIRHSITAVDAFLWNGEKSILIEDSWGKFYGLEGQRILTETWIKKRCYFAGYILDLSNEPVVPKPEPKPKPQPQPEPPKAKFRFTKPMQFGSRGEDVKQLQRMLRHEGLFPTKVDITGNYLQITAKAVKAWQIKHEIMDFAKTTDMRRIRFGEKSIAKANELYK